MSPTVPWCGFLRHKFHIPSCSFISSLACGNRLLTKDRMEYFEMTVPDPTCLLCQNYNETVQHLFSECPYTSLMLRACPYPLTINWQNWMQGSFFAGNLPRFEQNIAYLFTSMVIYLTWKELNSRIHGGQSIPASQLLTSVKRMVREKLYTCASFKRRLQNDPTLSHILY